MVVVFEREDPLDAAIHAALDAVADRRPADEIENRRVDLKEEAGRRAPDGSLLPSQERNERAAEHLASDVACFANTPGGGAVIVGAADDGSLPGTELDAQWLRARLYELLDRRVTVQVQVVRIHDRHRLLVLRVPSAIEPVKWRGKLRWRVDDRCVDVDATTWHHGALSRLGYDWSAESSGRPVGDARAAAVERARAYLRESGDAKAADLAGATTEDLLRRLNAVTPDGYLTRAGELVFVGPAQPALDYLRRPRPGADSVMRRRTSGVSLLEELHDVEQAVDVANEIVHVPGGFAVGQFRTLPSRAVREAVVNGVTHRDWLTPEPTLVEHVGDTMTVTSPGGFPSGVSPSNIITHPSRPRHRSLAELLASVRIAEREGIGVDRMITDMVRAGRPAPVYEETATPSVRVVLLGGPPDLDWVRLLAEVSPPDLAADLDGLLLVDHVVSRGWLDVATAAATLQKSPAEAEAAVARLEGWVIGGEPLVVPVDGTPAEASGAWRPSGALRQRLPRRTERMASQAGRRALALEWARARGRVSSTELASLAAAGTREAGAVLKRLRDDGLLRPSREGDPRGRGFHYLPLT